jgi:N-alpha-acetyltransferase 30
MWIESFDEYQLVYPHHMSFCLESIMKLCGAHLSESYSIYTYRYFLYSFPQVCWLVWQNSERQSLIGVLIGRLEHHIPKWASLSMTDEDTSSLSLTHLQHQQQQQHQHQHQEPKIKPYPPDHLSLFPLRGYIAMIVVDESYRRTGIGSALVRCFIEQTTRMGAHEITLETEISNRASLCLYRQLGFRREKRLFRYYLNGNDAFRLRYDISPVSTLVDSSDHY